LNLETAMKRRKVIFLSLLSLAFLLIATWGAPSRPMSVFLLFIGIHLVFLILRCITPEGMKREAHAWSIGRHYRPRQTGAGRWLDAPIAEVDKSTVGKLLASRMRREPGLHVVVRGRTAEPHPASSDCLYDPELDG
jgi:hypothetical protein